MCAPANGARRTISPNVGSRASDGFPGQTIGIVGLGRIGTRVAQLLAPWRARIIAYDPYVPPAHFLTLTPVDYQTLLRESDVVSFHVVLTPETRYMFGEAELKLMKPNAIVLNTARGKVVDEKALARAIDEGRIRGAAIDAFEEEPLPADSPLHKLGDRVVLSPHSASYTEGGELRQGVAWATRSVVTALKAGIPDNVYNQRGWRIGRSGTAHFGPNPRGFSPAVGTANRLIFVKNQRLKICIFCISAAQHGTCCSAPWNLICDCNDCPAWSRAER